MLGLDFSRRILTSAKMGCENVFFFKNPELDTEECFCWRWAVSK